MNSYLSRERKAARTSNDPLWLIVERDGKNTSYEFPPAGDDTTVVVGSSERAQIWIAQAAPIAFYVERVENDLCITSCYLGSDLCIDGRVVSGRYTIIGRARMDLAGVRLAFSVRDNPPTLPGNYVDATSEEPRLSVSSAVPEPPAPIESSKLSEKRCDATISAADAWFNATFLSDTDVTNAPPKLDEPSSVRAKLVSLKRVTVPPRPRETSRRPDSDFSQTQELEPVQLMAITEELKTVDLGLASSNSEAPTERAIRIGSVPSTHQFDSQPVVTLSWSGVKDTTRPLLFLLGAALGTILPVLCLVGVGRLEALSRNGAGMRKHSTYAARIASSDSPLRSSSTVTTAAPESQKVAELPRSVPSTARAFVQTPQASKRHVRAAASAR